MGIFDKKLDKGFIEHHKKIKISGVKFVIKKINPLLDFDSDNMPQIFTDFKSARPEKDKQDLPPEQIKKIMGDIANIIEAGVVEPKLEKINAKNKTGELTAEDMLRDFEFGYKLYTEILIHSLNRFSGLKKLFFSISLRRLLLTEWQKNLKSHRLDFYSLMADIA